jgi:hypothetical protein
MKIFVCTLPDGAFFTNAAGENVPIKNRIRQITNGIRDTSVEEDFSCGESRIMQVSCKSPEAALLMKLELATIPQVRVAEFQMTPQN